MATKIVILSDPGIDGAFAISLALLDTNLEVLGLLATAGNVPHDRATKNLRVILEHVDPERWPRLGEAPAIDYPSDGRILHGPTGFGNTEFPAAEPINLLSSEKLLVEIARQYPGEVTLVCLGPLSVVDRALDLCPSLPGLLRRIVVVGGAYREPGNAGPVSEFHFHCDPKSARRTLKCGTPVTLVTLDLMRQVLFSPTDLLSLPTDASRACAFLRQIVPYGIASTSNYYGIEGFHLKDVLGVIAVGLQEAMRTKSMHVDVETRGELTRGMTVFDQRRWENPPPNVDLAIEVDCDLVRRYISRILQL